jgi:hypothetical protein
MGLSKFFNLRWLLSKERGLPYCIKIVPMPCPEASHSTIKKIVKLGVARIRVIHIAFLRFSKYLVSS